MIIIYDASQKPNDTASLPKIGYAKPPVHTRFKPGVSGNPKGRPRGAKNRTPALHEERFRFLMLEEAYRIIKVKGDGKVESMPLIQAVVRSLAVNAAKGDYKSARLFLESVRHIEDGNKKSYDEYAQAMIEYKYSQEAKINDYKSRGLKPPHPIPHPDDIIIDPETGVVRLIGPFSPEEAKFMDNLIKRQSDLLEKIKALETKLASETCEKERQLLSVSLKFALKLHDRISTKISTFYW